MDRWLTEGILSGDIEIKAEETCPIATRDIKVNIRNRQKAIDDAGYGPLNPDMANNDFWKKKASRWDVSPSSAKQQICGNCAAFIKTPRMLDCIDKGLGNEEGNASWDVIAAGDLGYCEALDFKCASRRTCDAWIVGGPITKEKDAPEKKSLESDGLSDFSQWLHELNDDEVDALFPPNEDMGDAEAKWLLNIDGSALKRELLERRGNHGLEEKSANKPLRDPKGGLTAAGRAHFNRTEGSNLKPGVKGPADTPQKMRRKGSFLTRFFTNPRGPMKDEKGRPTRLALSAAAWGEPVPQTAEAAKRLAAKGQRLLERYRRYKEANKGKKELSHFDLEIKKLGQPVAGRSGTVSSQGGGTVGGGPSARANYNPKARDADGDGVIQEGTEYARPAEEREDERKKRNAANKKRFETQSGSADTRERGAIRNDLTARGFDAEAFGKLIEAEAAKLKPGQKTNWNPGRLPNGGKIAADGTYIPPDAVREDDKRMDDFYRKRREGRGRNNPNTTAEGDVIPNKNRDKRTPPKSSPSSSRPGSADAQERRSEANAPKPGSRPRGMAGSADSMERRIEDEEGRRTGKGRGYDKLESEEEINNYRAEYGLPPVNPKSPSTTNSGSADTQERRSEKKSLYVDDNQPTNGNEEKFSAYLDSLTDEEFDTLYPESSDETAEVEVKVIFDVLGAYARRALTNRRKRRRRKFFKSERGE